MEVSFSATEISLILKKQDGPLEHFFESYLPFYPTTLKGCGGIIFTHGVRMGIRAVGLVGGWRGKSLSGLYLRNRKV